MAHMADEPEDKSEAMILSNLEEIKSRFSVLLSAVMAALEANHVRTRDVHSVIIEMYPQYGNVIPATNLDSLFTAASSYRIWSYKHHSPVEKLIRRFIPDHSGIIKEYKEHLTGFYTTTKLIDYIRFFNNADSESGRNELDIGSFTPAHYKKLRIKLGIDRNINTCSLDYIQVLWEQFAEEFDIPFLTAVLDSILEGSLVITWLVPPEVADKIAGSVHQATPFLKRQHIVSVSIDDNVIYCEESETVLGAEDTRAIMQMRDHLRPLLERRIRQYCEPRHNILISEEVLDNIITQVIRIESADLGQFYTVSIHTSDIGKFTQVPAGGWVVGAIRGAGAGLRIGALIGVGIGAAVVCSAVAVYVAAALGTTPTAAAPPAPMAYVGLTAAGGVE